MIRLAVIWFWASSFSWATDIYHHDLRSYPKLGECNSQASALAESLRKKANVDIYWYGTLKETANDCDIRLSYLAEAPLEFESSVDVGMSASIRKGIHASLEECRSYLPKEIEIFERATGLKSWVSYCYRRDTFLESYPYVSFVQGIGKGKNTIFSSDTIVPVRPNRGWGDVANQVSTSAGAIGVVLASLRIRPYISASDKELTIRFYGKERLWLSSARFAQHTDPKVCEAQVDEVRRGLMTADVPPISVYCGEYAAKDFQLNLLGLSKNIFGVAQIDGILDPKRFGNLDACLTTAPETLKFYREKLGKKTLAGICGDGTGAFQTTIFIEKSVSPIH